MVQFARKISLMKLLLYRKRSFRSRNSVQFWEISGLPEGVDLKWGFFNCVALCVVILSSNLSFLLLIFCFLSSNFMCFIFFLASICNLFTFWSVYVICFLSNRSMYFISFLPTLCALFPFYPVYAICFLSNQSMCFISSLSSTVISPDK